MCDARGKLGDVNEVAGGRMGPSYEGNHRPGRGRFFVMFGYVWITLGLFAGTVTLLLVRRPVLSMLHDLGAGELAEARAVFALVVTAMLGSVVFARHVARRLASSKSIRVRQTGFGLLALSAVLCLWAWSRPDKLIAGATVHSSPHHQPVHSLDAQSGN
jgi:hypothetical protein